MKGNLIWSMRNKVAAFVPDDNGKFEIIDGQIVAVPVEKIVYKEKVIDNSKKIEQLLTIQRETLRQTKRAASYSRRPQPWDNDMDGF